MENSKLIYSDRKEIDDCLEIGDKEVWEGAIRKAQVKTFRGDRCLHYLDGSDDYTCTNGTL